jgi:hypothetical protein
LHQLFEQAKAARLPSFDSSKNAASDRAAREVGLAGDEVPDDSATALNLLDTFYPSASHSSRAKHFGIIMDQLAFQRARRAGRRQSAELSLANAARRAGFILVDEMKALMRRSGLKVQGDAAPATTLATGAGRVPRKPATLDRAEIARSIKAAGLATA